MKIEHIEPFAKKIIEFHGFRFNESHEGFSCLIPDKLPFPSNEGLVIWFYSQRRQRFETKLEKFHTRSRVKRMEQMLNLSGKVYQNTVSPLIEDYLASLKKLGFEEIGKGLWLFGQGKIFNFHKNINSFENPLVELKKLELITINNPIVQFTEQQGYFNVRNKDKLVWDLFADEKISSHQKQSMLFDEKYPKQSTLEIQNVDDYIYVVITNKNKVKVGVSQKPFTQIGILEDITHFKILEAYSLNTPFAKEIEKLVLKKFKPHIVLEGYFENVSFDAVVESVRLTAKSLRYSNPKSVIVDNILYP